MEFLIESAFAKIYRIPYKDGEFACLKKIKKEKHYQSLANEVAILKQFNHPNIIKVLDDSNVHNGEIILELGITDLFEYTRDDNRTKIDLLDVIYPQMKSAVSEVHRLGYIHIDVKLENFLIFPNNVVKLCDFGLAQKISDPPPQIIKGTVNYASPDMLMLNKITTKHDYWSLAVSLYILITGHDPWPGKNIHEIMENIIRANYYDFPKEIVKNKAYKKYIEIILYDLQANY
jgi:serine/threonine protein kinase